MNAARPLPFWAMGWLLAAGVYNLVWGAVVIGWPNALFDAIAAERPNYPALWQCIGMIVGVYGVGYLIAASDPRRHWPIVLVGLLGKIFGPMGFAFALLHGTFPPLFGLTILTNDLLWWAPFAAILWHAYRHREALPLRQTFVHEGRLAADPEAVFQWHESPDALTRLIPPWERMHVAERSGSLVVGSRVVLRGRVFVLPVRWVAVHTEYAPPHLFADQQEAGPFAWWYHRHHVLADGHGGTLLRDEVEYQLPFGLLGAYFGSRFIQKKLTAMFTYRHAVTRECCEQQKDKPS